MSKPTGTSYRIRTIADIFSQVPKDRIEFFLKDLRNMLEQYHRIEECLSRLAKQKVICDLSQGMEWIDDGRHDMRFTLPNDQRQDGAQETERTNA